MRHTVGTWIAVCRISRPGKLISLNKQRQRKQLKNVVKNTHSFTWNLIQFEFRFFFAIWKHFADSGVRLIFFASLSECICEYGQFGRTQWASGSCYRSQSDLHGKWATFCQWSGWGVNYCTQLTSTLAFCRIGQFWLKGDPESVKSIRNGLEKIKMLNVTVELENYSEFSSKYHLNLKWTKILEFMLLI